ncbi:MAG: HupE/UreJ family protein [Candidatus Acidiferrales bacterium]
MSRRAACFIWFFVCVLLAAAAASAHETRPAYLEIKETAPGRFRVLWRTPLMAGMRLPVVLKLPDNVRDLREPSEQELSDSLVERRWVDAGPDGLAGKRIEFNGLQMTITDVLVRVEMLDGRQWTTIAHPSQPRVEMAASQSRTQAAAMYSVLGIEHILYGIDHLLFVLGLMLLVRDFRSLVKTITAFTVAHSITLGAATLGFIHVEVAPVEATIALSILFLAVELVRSQRGESGIAQRAPWIVAFAFGLLHGLGFASTLGKMGLPHSEIPIALLLFNVGVELGQLGFVLVFIGFVRSLATLEIRWPNWTRAIPAYSIGAFAALTFLQRVDSIFW